MENPEVNTYFSKEALIRFTEAAGKTVAKIVCHLWQNSINTNDIVEIIDNVELRFTDGTKLTIASNENGDGLDAIDFNYKETAMALHHEFDGKIKLFALDASDTKMWEDIKGKKLIAVKLTKLNDYYKSDSILLNFGEEGRVISVNPIDGVIIDYYEEV